MKVHFIAIGGSAMHNLALAMHHKGFEVSGSDDEIFEPSKSRLDKYGLLPTTIGWNPDKIDSNLDYIILGMHARKDNPELLKANELGLKVYSYPEFIYEQSKNKTRVVIAGSHGKTTISAMVLHVLHYHGMDCDFMIGAQLDGFETMVKLTEKNEFILLEGDEYLSSPIDLRPKFLHYKPNIALISGIAWDHVNVFPTYEEYFQQFELLLDSMEIGGAVVYNQTDAEVQRAVDSTKNEIKKFGYGLPDYTIDDGKVSLNTADGIVPLSIFGKHNMNNLEGARWICNQMGISDEQFYEAIPGFTGASRRLEILHEDKNLVIYRDFAHAPSKVNATVNAVKENFENRKVIACFELHTFSSLSIDFMNQYSGSMDMADEALVYFNPEVVAHKKLPALNAAEIKERFGNEAIQVFDNNQALLSAIKKSIGTERCVLLIMSSGSFDGINWKKELGIV